MVYPRVASLCAESEGREDLGQRVLSLRGKFQDEVRASKAHFRRELYLEYRVRSSEEFRRFLERKEPRGRGPSGAGDGPPTAAGKGFSGEAGNNPLLLKAVGRSFKLVAHVPPEALSQKLLRVPLKFLFKFKRGPSAKGARESVEVAESAPPTSESHRRYRRVLEESGLAALLEARDSCPGARRGIFEVEHGSGARRSRLRTLSALLAFAMTLAVFYAKK